MPARKYTEAQRLEFMALIDRGGSVRAACAVVGVHPDEGEQRPVGPDEQRRPRPDCRQPQRRAGVSTRPVRTDDVVIIAASQNAVVSPCSRFGAPPRVTESSARTVSVRRRRVVGLRVTVPRLIGSTPSVSRARVRRRTAHRPSDARRGEPRGASGPTPLRAARPATASPASTWRPEPGQGPLPGRSPRAARLPGDAADAMTAVRDAQPTARRAGPWS